MTRGVMMVAHNGNRGNYYQMAEYTASRVEKFLNLPTSLITDNETYNSVNKKYKFDNVYILEKDGENYLKQKEWNNKGRYRVFDVSPYDETLLLDTDYMINSNSLLSSFDYSSDFVCHNKCKYMMLDKNPEYLYKSNHEILWATVIRFKKTKRVEHIFNMMSMIQYNYQHYGKIYNFMPYVFRNDYALTIALRTINNHIYNKEDFFTNKLLHISEPVSVKRIDDTKYMIERIVDINDRKVCQYMYINDLDFHMLDKNNFMELI